MPIIVYKPQGVSFFQGKVNGEIFFEVPLTLNYVYADGRRLHLHKKNSFDSQTWKDLEALTHYPVLIHFNESDEESLERKKSNWSPVIVSKDIAAVSVGQILKVAENKIKSHSDLKVFSETCFREISKLMPDFLFGEQAQWMIGNILTDEAAIAVINSAGKVSIFNESKGEYYEKLWFFDSFLMKVHTNQAYGFYNIFE